MNFPGAMPCFARHQELASLSAILFFLALVTLLPARADDSATVAAFSEPKERFRIERPGANTRPATKNAPPPVNTSVGTASDSCCAASSQETPPQLVSRLPEEGLYRRWHRNFAIPTICPVNRCHGTCASSGQGCTMRLNSLDLFFDECVDGIETGSLSADKATCCGGGKL